MISLAESEAELASVLSHEIAHENSCDWRTAPWKGNLFELIVLVPTVVLGGPAGIALASGSGWAATLARARSSRSGEQRADRLAAQYLVRAGYDPTRRRNSSSVFRRNRDAAAGNPADCWPRTRAQSDREKQLERIIPNLPPPEFARHDEAEFLRMRQAVREYDEMYSRLVGVHVPGHDAPPPELSRRPPPQPDASARAWLQLSILQRMQSGGFHRSFQTPSNCRLHLAMTFELLPAAPAIWILAGVAYNSLLPGVPC